MPRRLRSRYASTTCTGPATLAALRALSRGLRRHLVAWLLARSSTLQPAAEYLFGRLEKNGAARITLAPLDQDAVTDMVTDAFGVPADEALTDLARGAAGNPALVAELISGAIVRCRTCGALLLAMTQVRGVSSVDLRGISHF